MIKELLDNLKNAITDLPSSPEIAYGIKEITPMAIKKYFLEEIGQDLKQLAEEDPRFLEGTRGEVDYYSPFAAKQIKNKGELLTIYLERMLTLEATLLVFYQRMNASKDEENANEHTDKAKALLAASDFNQLRADADIVAMMDLIKKRTQVEQQLRVIDIKLKTIDSDIEAEEIERVKKELSTEKKEAEAQLQVIKAEFPALPEGNPISTLRHYRATIHSKLALHENIVKAIPNGMLDVKRALSIEHQARYLQSRIDNLKMQLSDLETKSPSAANTEKKELLLKKIASREEALKTLGDSIFMTIEAEDKVLKDKLHDLKKIMARSITDYQALLTEGGDLNTFFQKTTGFYWENLFLYKKTVASIQKYLSTHTLTEQGTFLHKCFTEALEKMPADDVIKIALEHVNSVDSDVRTRLDHHKTAFGDDSHRFAVAFYKKGSEALVKKIMEKSDGNLFYFPYSSNSYTLDNPAHMDIAGALGNCHGETQMFLSKINGKTPTICNICPDTLLVNYQLDQSKPIDIGRKSTPIGDPYVAHDDSSDSKDFARWDTIKHLLTAPTQSESYGDLCWLKFSGAKVPGFDKNVSHVMGFIKMKEASPYKYIVYDYNMGLVGFSNELQLEMYFKALFEEENGYFPYSKCTLYQAGEVSKECSEFFKSTKPLAKPSKELTTCTRNFWDKERFIFFIRAAERTDLPQIFAQIQSRPAEELEEYYAELVNNNPSYAKELLEFALNTGDIDLIMRTLSSKTIIDKAERLTLGASFTLNATVLKALMTAYQENKLSPSCLYPIFKNNTELLAAMWFKDPATIESLSESQKNNVLTYAIKNSDSLLFKKLAALGDESSWIAIKLDKPLFYKLRTLANENDKEIVGLAHKVLVTEWAKKTKAVLDDANNKLKLIVALCLKDEHLILSTPRSLIKEMSQVNVIPYSLTKLIVKSLPEDEELFKELFPKNDGEFLTLIDRKLLLKLIDDGYLNVDLVVKTFANDVEVIQKCVDKTIKADKKAALLAQASIDVIKTLVPRTPELFAPVITKAALPLDVVQEIIRINSSNKELFASLQKTKRYPNELHLFDTTVLVDNIKEGKLDVLDMVSRHPNDYTLIMACLIKARKQHFNILQRADVAIVQRLIEKEIIDDLKIIEQLVTENKISIEFAHRHFPAHKPFQTIEKETHLSDSTLEPTPPPMPSSADITPAETKEPSVEVAAAVVPASTEDALQPAPDNRLVEAAEESIASQGASSPSDETAVPTPAALSVTLTTVEVPAPVVPAPTEDALQPAPDNRLVEATGESIAAQGDIAPPPIEETAVPIPAAPPVTPATVGVGAQGEIAPPLIVDPLPAAPESSSTVDSPSHDTRLSEDTRNSNPEIRLSASDPAERISTDSTSAPINPIASSHSLRVHGLFATHHAPEPEKRDMANSLSEEEKGALKQNCLSLINQIKACSIDENDEFLIRYCNDMTAQAKTLVSNLELQHMEQQLSQTLSAVNSLEMQAIKDELARLNKKTTAFLGLGRDNSVLNKINHIKEALKKLPLSDRASAFQNSVVKAALGEHRHSFRSLLPIAQKTSSIANIERKLATNSPSSDSPTLKQ